MTVTWHTVIGWVVGIATHVVFRYFGERELLREIATLRYENQWLKAALKAEIFKDRS